MIKIKEINKQKEREKQYLNKVKIIFERKYKRELSEDEVQQIAESLKRFVKISFDVHQRVYARSKLANVLVSIKDKL